MSAIRDFGGTLIGDPNPLIQRFLHAFASVRRETLYGGAALAVAVIGWHRELTGPLPKEVRTVTAILVLCTIALFLIVDYWRTRQHVVSALLETVPVPDFIPESFVAPPGLFFGPGHTWARVETNGLATVGIDDFASKLMGRIDRLDVARVGASLGTHDAAVVVHQDDKSAAFAAPFEGVVTDVNEALLENPDRLPDDPYESNWLVRIRPANLSATLRSLRVGEEAQTWMRRETERLRDFLARQWATEAVGVTLTDGGVPVDNVLEHLTPLAWEQFEEDFLATRAAS